MELISKIIDKISQYEILNYLIPGITLCLVLEHIGYSILVYNTIINFFVYYIVGLINSRVASLLIEPLFKYRKNSGWVDYILYNKAKQKCPFIGTLSAHNNMYRDFVAVWGITIIAYGYRLLTLNCVWLLTHQSIILFVLLLLLFIFAYKKQTGYVAKNVKDVIKEQ